MKSITTFTVSVLFFLKDFALNATVRDTVPANINNYTKAQFLKELVKMKHRKK